MKLRDVLLKLRFREDWSAVTDKQPAYSYDFGNLELKAAQVTNEYLTPVFLITGVAHGARSLREICLDLPLEVESFEQGAAWLAYALGNDFRPKKLTPWLEQGRKWSDTLPWEQARRRYESRPHCIVERDWFKIAARKLREQAEVADVIELASFRFDGDVLQIRTAGAFIAMPAKGAPWDKPYFLAATRLVFLPKRIMRSMIEVSVWEGRLVIDGRRFDLVDPAIQSAKRLL